MADFNSSLPVRTQDAGDVIAKIADATVPSQQLAISAAGEASVKATDFDIRDLSSATDSVTVVATNLDIRDLSSATDSVTVVATDLDIRNLAFATDKVDVSGSSVTVTATNLDIRDLAFATDKVDVSGSSVTVTATNLDIRDLSAATDSVAAWISDATGAAFSSSNPLPVVMSSGGTPINDYKDASAIAAGASDSHDYTVTALKTLHLEQIESTSSGKAKMLLSIETGVASGVFTPAFAQFNSTATPNMSLKLYDPILVAAGVRVRVTMTNRDLSAADLYSTISGYEI